MTAAYPATTAVDFNDEDELFDAVLTGSVDKESSGKSIPTKQSTRDVKTQHNAKPKQPSEASKLRELKTNEIYIGTFPWWIKEEDIIRVAKNVGVRDVIEVKFAENKLNGLSKGYVKVTVGSDVSGKLLLERVPKCTLGGEKLFCRYASNSKRSLFEDMDKQSDPEFPPRAGILNMNDSGASFLPQDSFDSTMPQQFFNKFEDTVPPVPNPFLSYPPPPCPQMLPPSLPPFMFLNYMNSPSNPPYQDQNVNCETAGTSQEWHNSTSISDEKDFEGLINRNKAVSSSAISKAVSGATTGDLRVAMETLLTAISIIKQSSVYQDERCQAMVTSLKDCLVSIQGSYGFSRQSEERERKKSSSKESRRSSRGDRNRSRSSERSSSHSKECSREQDRYRDRDKHY